MTDLAPLLSTDLNHDEFVAGLRNIQVAHVQPDGTSVLEPQPWALAAAQRMVDLRASEARAWDAAHTADRHRREIEQEASQRRNESWLRRQDAILRVVNYLNGVADALTKPGPQGRKYRRTRNANLAIELRRLANEMRIRGL